MSVPAGVFVRARTESAVKRIATDATKLLMIVFTLAFLFICFGYPKFFCDSRVEAVPGSASNEVLVLGRISNLTQSKRICQARFSLSADKRTDPVVIILRYKRKIFGVE